MKILVIDKSPQFLQAARNFIGVLPACECLTAASLQEALGLEAARQADMVLIDYSLRSAGGESAARRFKALAPAARVVLLTEDVAAYRDSCMAAGADECAAKDAIGRDLPRLVAHIGSNRKGKAFA
ncbi:MAG: response regulator transcription factor [Betaproteobacteria bacterium]|jgi:DNA-binding NarL/FixJ family response regulator|nr:response regulator transcription factor [Betaproteobacteria bacterium]